MAPPACDESHTGRLVRSHYAAVVVGYRLPGGHRIGGRIMKRTKQFVLETEFDSRVYGVHSRFDLLAEGGHLVEGDAAVRHFLRRIDIRDQLWRYSIAAFTLAFGGFGVIMILSPDGAAGSLHRSVVIAALSFTTIPMAAVIATSNLGTMWWSKTSPGGFNTVFVVYADLGLTAVLACFRNAEAAMAGVGLFAATGAFVAHFVRRSVMIWHLVFATAVIVVFGVRLAGSGAPVATAIAYVGVGVLVANGVVMLHGRYTAEVQAALRRQLVASSTDPLTAVLNRRGFRFWSNELMRMPPSHFMVAAIDVDRFKDINDRFGHAVGDSVLRNVARTLTRGFPESAVIARTGGDEFAVAGAVAGDEVEFLSTWIHDTPTILPDGGHAELSIGIVVASCAAPADPRSSAAGLADHLHAIADEALKQSKIAGRGRTTVRALDL